jgi:hypothetical protein
MGSDSDKTEGQFGVCGIDSVELVHPVCQGSDGAKVPRGHGVVHGAASSLAVLLVVQVEAHAFALQEGDTGHQMGNDLAVAKQPDIHPLKLHGASRFSGQYAMVYLPGQRRKKKATMLRSVMAALMAITLLAIVCNNNLEGHHW